MQVDLHPEAQSELRRAALWHDQQRAGLGDELFADVNVADIYITAGAVLLLWSSRRLNRKVSLTG